MSSSTVASMRDDSSMNENVEGPRAGGPVPRRSFTPVQKLEHVAAYEAATTRGQGGAYLRGEGLYASQIAEWRKLRDAGVLTGKDSWRILIGVAPQPCGLPRVETLNSRDLQRANHGLPDSKNRPHSAPGAHCHRCGEVLFRSSCQWWQGWATTELPNCSPNRNGSSNGSDKGGKDLQAHFVKPRK